MPMPMPLPPPILLLYLLLVLLYLQNTFSCTTLAVGRLASADGSVMVTQSDDGDGQVDARIVAIPARTFQLPTLRHIYPNTLTGYPRYVGTDRGIIPPYSPTQYDPTPTPSIGSIPQVASTYAYWEGDYGILNSRGVGIGETSCSSRILAPADTNETVSLLPIEELTRIAMERSNSSRSAVLLMGEMAERYGFYGVLRLPNPLTTVPNEGGESLMVGDANEAWVFHILSDGKGGAIWCAQRVDDDKVAVVANMFTIRHVDLTDSKGTTFLYSDSMLDVALNKGWWKEGEPFDFTRIYSYGEYYAQGYSSNRMWRAFSLLAPSMKLNRTLLQPLFLKPKYPFSVVPDTLIKPRDLMSIHRDYYQNTSIDMSKMKASGPWGLPVRFDPEQAYNGDIVGNWYRPIGSFRTGYTCIVHLFSSSIDMLHNGKNDYNIIHFAPHTPLGSTFVPIFGKMLNSRISGGGGGGDPIQAPDGLSIADPRANGKGINRHSLYWVVRLAINIAYLRYCDMHPMIVKEQNKMEEQSQLSIDALFQNKQFTPEQSANIVKNHTTNVISRWLNVTDQMIIHWSDGFFNEYFGDKPVDTEYPKEWLNMVGYQNGPPNPIPNLQ
jgi:dipeptidase